MGSNAGVLLSQDNAQTFAPLNDGLSNRVVHSLAQDPQDPDVLYAGTEDGLFRITLKL